MNFFEDQIVLDNVSNLISFFFLALVISFLVSPLIGKLAYTINALDLPAKMRSFRDRSVQTRLHQEVTPRAGGLAIAASLLLVLIFANIQDDNTLEANLVNKIPLVLGILAITITGLLDDVFELTGPQQIFGHIVSALIVIIGGLYFPENISILNLHLDLNSWSETIEIFGLNYDFIFPNHLLTLLWIVGVINVVNWVGGVDGLNITVSSIIGFTMLLFALSAGKIPLALIISIFIGANLGLLPYNWNPAKIFPGAVGDCLNGFMLAVFALLGDTRWTATIIIFALPIIDAVIVLYLRFKENKKLLTKPWKILSVSDTNHLHHRLLAAGYSRKGVVLVEAAIVSILSAITITIGINTTDDDRSDKLIVAFMVAMSFLVTFLTIVYILMIRAKRKTTSRLPLNLFEKPQKKAVVKVIVEDDGEDEEGDKFYY